MEIQESCAVLRMFKVSCEINYSHMASMSLESCSPKRARPKPNPLSANMRVLKGKLLRQIILCHLCWSGLLQKVSSHSGLRMPLVSIGLGWRQQQQQQQQHIHILRMTLFPASHLWQCMELLGRSWRTWVFTQPRLERLKEFCTLQLFIFSLIFVVVVVFLINYSHLIVNRTKSTDL